MRIVMIASLTGGAGKGSVVFKRNDAFVKSEQVFSLLMQRPKGLIQRMASLNTLLGTSFPLTISSKDTRLF